jgi:hypothetical protein
MPGDKRTLEEVAEAFRVSPRWLRETMKALSVPVLRRGRIILFDDVAISSLEEAMRCRSESYAGKTAATRSRSSGRSVGSQYDSALKATAPQPREKKHRSSRPKSSGGTTSGNVVALIPSRRR